MLRSDVRGEILDHGLTLALAFGPEWLQPIQPQLARRFPTLSSRELDEYDAHCRQVRDVAQQRLSELAIGAGELDTVRDQWEAEIRAKHPWISEENLRHLYSQGCYYLYKNGFG
jgi:hypothetical protein